MSQNGSHEQPWILSERVRHFHFNVSVHSPQKLAAFDYHFGALTQTNNEFMKSYFGLMSVFSLAYLFRQFIGDASRNDTLGSPPASAILKQALLPLWVLRLMSKFSQARNLVHARQTATLANAVARQLVDTKAEALMQGRGQKDILSLLSKSWGSG